ncbi:MAG: pilin [Minisyncoccia bacterium]
MVKELKINNLIFSIIFLSIIFLPFMAQAINIWNGTGGCNNASSASASCNVCDAIIVTQNIINQILVPLALSGATIMILVGGIMMMTSSGSEERLKKAKGILFNAIIGLVIALVAWVIVNEILHVLVDAPTASWWATIQCQ